MKHRRYLVSFTIFEYYFGEFYFTIILRMLPSFICTMLMFRRKSLMRSAIEGVDIEDGIIRTS